MGGTTETGADATAPRSATTASGREVRLRVLEPADRGILRDVFRAVVAANEGYPQDPAIPLADAEIDEYWFEAKAAVVAATLGDGGDRLVGSYFLKPNGVGRAAHVANAGYLVAAEARGLGIGTVLVEDSMAVAAALGFDALQFNFVFESNPARRLYERLGFEVVGRVPSVIDGEAVLVLWRRLTDG